MGVGGGQLNHDLQRAQDEKLVIEDKQKWDDLTDEEKNKFLFYPGVTWGHNVPDENRNEYASRTGQAASKYLPAPNAVHASDVKEGFLKQIHIGVFGACRILLQADYIHESSLKKLCESVDKEALDATPSNVIWKTGTTFTSMDLQNCLNDPVETLNAAWNNGDEERKKTFVEYSLTLTDEDLKASVQTLSKLIKARGGFTPEGDWNNLNGFVVRKSMFRT